MINPYKLHKILQIKKIKKETSNKITLFFDDKIIFFPGQFIMLWLPDVDEKPFTLSYWNHLGFGITIEKKGAFTEKLFNLKQGASLGFRGPFGKSFKIYDNAKNIGIVGGGCGMAPLAPLIDLLKKTYKKIYIFNGARTKSDLLFLDRFEVTKYFTDDGSYGQKGFLTEFLSDNKLNLDTVYTCGPEIMMKKISELCLKNKIKCQVSLERYMKCAIGICASCVCGDQRVCVDGPVFNITNKNGLTDFGKSYLNKTGKESSFF